LERAFVASDPAKNARTSTSNVNEPKRIMIVGNGRAGTDTACEYLAKVTELRFAGTTSLYLAKYVAARLGVSEQDAYSTRHLNRNLWHRVGREIRKQDPALLIRESLLHAEIVGGIRDHEEIAACKQDHLVDLIAWIDNDRVSNDSTVTFVERDCDIVVPNHGSLEEFYWRLLRLARFASLPMRT
jgi:hypothetical protein